MSDVPNQSKVEYSQLEVGYEFPPAHYQLDASTVSAYLQAVEETHQLFQGSALVPPMAVAALTMASLSEHLTFPAGAIHVSQDFEFTDTVTTGDTLTSHASVARKQDRGKLHLLAIDLNVNNLEGKTVLTGKTSFVLPDSSAQAETPG